jgi:ATP-dependent NAD(P)H-hydrate dehydratase
MLIVKCAKLAVLTPNVVEFDRLCDGILKSRQTVDKLSQALGNVVIVQKGQVDTISNGASPTTCNEPGALRRVGGQGDILSGAIGTFCAWSNMAKSTESSSILNAAYAGCLLTRKSSFKAFNKHGRSMITSEVVHQIGPAFHDLFDDKQMDD